MKRTVVGAFAFAVAISAMPARADVIPKRTLFRILDATPQLKRSQPAIAIRDWRFYKVSGSDASGFIMPEFDDYGFLRNGQDLLIVPNGLGDARKSV